MSVRFSRSGNHRFRWFLLVFFTIIFSTASVQAEQIILEMESIDSDADYHCIFMREEGKSYDYSSPIHTGSQIEVPVNGLQSGVTYYFVARSFGDNLISIDSNEVSFFVQTKIDPPEEPATVWLEAEDGDIMSPMKVENASGDSSGEFIRVPNGTGNAWNNSPTAGGAEYHFEVPVAGTYAIWGRVLAPNGEDDSFWISVDKGPYALWDLARSNTWQWDQAANRDGADPVIFHLSAGSHTLSITHREDGSALDKLAISNVPTFVPSGQGEPVDQPDDVPLDSDGDGIDDLTEIEIYGTDPFLADTDGDGIDDGAELAYWGDDWNSDDDSDGIINLLDTDSDNDGVSDGEEIANGDDPRVPPPPQEQELVTVSLEAEEGDIVSPMQVEDANTGSSGAFIRIPQGTGNHWTYKPAAGRSEYHFQVPVAGQYTIWGRVQAPTTEDDSFWVTVDDGPYALWDLARSDGWQWDQVNHRDGADPVGYYLSAGSHTIAITHREDGSALDRLVITNDPDFEPSAHDEPADPPEDDPIDSDGDGIFDNDEIDLYGTDPLLADTDDDGIDDGAELAYWGDDWNSDEDSDGIINLLDTDSDNDGVSDGQEIADGDDPRNPPPPAEESDTVWLEAEDGDIGSPMQIENGDGDSSGDYIRVPNGSGNNSRNSAAVEGAEYHFQIPEDGEYFIWGRVFATNGEDDSFWVSVDGGPYALWDLPWSDNWQWAQISDRNGADPVVYQLEAGNHTIIIKHREDGSALDKLAISNDPVFEPTGEGESVEPPPVEGPTTISLEAEDGDIATPMTIANGDGESSGDYIHVPNGSGNNSRNSASVGGAEYHFQVPEDGEYFIWGRVLATNGQDDSFWVSMDDGSYALWDLPRSDSWQWAQISDRDGADPVVYQLEAGSHCLTIKHREDGSALDKLIISADPEYIPE